MECCPIQSCTELHTKDVPPSQPSWASPQGATLWSCGLEFPSGGHTTSSRLDEDGCASCGGTSSSGKFGVAWELLLVVISLSALYRCKSNLTVS